MKKNILRIILIVLIILWMRLVFGFSSDDAETSSSLSFRIANFFVKNKEAAESLESVIRKIAHLSEYAARTDSCFMDSF